MTLTPRTAAVRSLRAQSARSAGGLTFTAGIVLRETRFGPIIAADLRKRRPRPHSTWHLDEVYLKIDGRMVYLWRAVDAGLTIAGGVATARSRRSKRDNARSNLGARTGDFLTEEVECNC